jgi:hypothetical protein
MDPWRVALRMKILKLVVYTVSKRFWTGTQDGWNFRKWKEEYKGPTRWGMKSSIKKPSRWEGNS